MSNKKPNKIKYNGILRIDFVTDNPDKFMSKLREDFLKIENDELKLTEHEYVPEMYHVKTHLGRTINTPPSLFNENLYDMMVTLNNLEFDLETLCMYGDQKDINKYLNQIKKIVNETTELTNQITKEDTIHEMQ